MGIQQRALQEQLSNPSDRETLKLRLPHIVKRVWKKEFQLFTRRGLSSVSKRGENSGAFPPSPPPYGSQEHTVDGPGRQVQSHSTRCIGALARKTYNRRESLTCNWRIWHSWGTRGPAKLPRGEFLSARTGTRWRRCLSKLLLANFTYNKKCFSRFKI